MKKKSAGLCQLLLSQPKFHYIITLSFNSLVYDMASIRSILLNQSIEKNFLSSDHTHIIYSKSIIGIFKITFFVKKIFYSEKVFDITIMV